MLTILPAIIAHVGDEDGCSPYRQVTRAGKTIAAFRATLSMAVASLNASRRRDNLSIKLTPAFLLGTLNKLHLLGTTSSYASTILMENALPFQSPHMKLRWGKSVNRGGQRWYSPYGGCLPQQELQLSLSAWGEVGAFHSSPGSGSRENGGGEGSMDLLGDV